MSVYPNVTPENVNQIVLSGADCLCRFEAGGRTGDAAAFLRAQPSRW